MPLHSSPSPLSSSSLHPSPLSAPTSTSPQSSSPPATLNCTLHTVMGVSLRATQVRVREEGEEEEGDGGRSASSG